MFSFSSRAAGFAIDDKELAKLLEATKMQVEAIEFETARRVFMADRAIYDMIGKTFKLVERTSYF